MNQRPFFKNVIRIAIPVALQSMLQSSFSMIDQVMVGQLGSTSIAAIGIAGKFAFLYSVVIGAVTAIAGIMISQYIGQKEQKAADRSLCVNLLVAGGIGLLFTMLSLLFPEQIMQLYSDDPDAVRYAASYLRIIAGTYLPIGVASTLSVMLRCNDRAKAPLYAAIISTLTNTGLNYILIFGKLGAPALGIQGAAIASVVSQWVNTLAVALFFRRLLSERGEQFALSVRLNGAERRQYLVMLLPVMVNEFLNLVGGLAPSWIAVNPKNELQKEVTARNIHGVREVLGHLAGGHPVGFFPSGAVSDLKLREMRIRDREWQEPVIRLIQKARVPIVPIRFFDHNSMWFYYLGLLDWRIRTCIPLWQGLRAGMRSVHASAAAHTAWIPTKDSSLTDAVIRCAV